MIVLAVIVAVLFVAAMTQFARNGWGTLDDLGSDPSDAFPPVTEERRPAEHAEHFGFAAIRHADPAFDLDVFYARVSEMFLAYHAALANHDLTPARRFIDERYYPVLAERLAAAPARSQQLAVESARGLTAAHEEGMDRVRVMLTASAVGSAEKIQEYWTLVRRQGALTKADLSLYKCPNCGAPTSGDDPTRCAYCGARLADPALDWVVSRIDAD